MKPTSRRKESRCKFTLLGISVDHARVLHQIKSFDKDKPGMLPVGKNDTTMKPISALKILTLINAIRQGLPLVDTRYGVLHSLFSSSMVAASIHRPKSNRRLAICCSSSPRPFGPRQVKAPYPICKPWPTLCGSLKQVAAGSHRC